MVLLVRHGSTNFNSGAAKERIRGWMNLPLNAEGRREIHQIARVIRNVPFTKIYASNLARGEQTAKIILETLQDTQHRTIPIIMTQALRPWNLGIYQGEPIDKKMEAMMITYQTTKMSESVPDGEPFTAFLQRYLPFLRRVLREARHKGPILIVTHTRCLRATDAWLNAGQRESNTVDDAVFKKHVHLGTGEGLVLEWNGAAWVRHVIHPDGHITRTEGKGAEEE